MEGVISRTVSFSSPVGEVKEELFLISGKLTRRHTVLGELLQKLCSMNYTAEEPRVTQCVLGKWANS